MRRLAVGAVIVLGLSGAGAAQAALPVTKTHKIVPGVSIGGVKLGQSLKAARKAWGRDGGCKTEGGATVCTYSQPSTFSSDDASVADFIVRDGAVITVELFANFQGIAGMDAAIAPLEVYRTSKHIGLGSTEQAVHAAYPKASEDQHHSGVVLEGPHAAAKTMFGILEGEVAAITITNQ